MKRWIVSLAVVLLGAPLFAAEVGDLQPVRIGTPVGGHIHPAVCRSNKGTLVVTFGQVNHHDLRITRSTDNGKTWSTPTPFVHSVGKTFYPGSLTTLADGRLVHCWNRWNAENNEKEPRFVLYSISTDDGVTWGEPQPFPRNPEVRSVIRHPLVELAPDRWLVSLDDNTFLFNPATASSQPFGDGRVHGLVPIVRTPKGTFVSGAGVRSTDDGRTWQAIEKFPDIKSQGWRHELVCLSNGWLLASEVVGPGVGGNLFRYRISKDDGLTWDRTFEFHNPGRPIGGRACPRTVELDAKNIGVAFYDVDKDQPGGPAVFFLPIPLAKLDG